MHAFNSLEFDVKILRTKDGLAKVKLVVKNTGSETVDGWDVGLDMDYPVDRAWKADHSVDNGMCVLSGTGGCSTIKPGKKKVIKFDLNVGDGEVTEADILAALTAVGTTGPVEEPVEDEEAPGEDAAGEAEGGDEEPEEAPEPAEPGPVPTGLQVASEVTGVWDQTFNLEVTITNSTASPVEGWSLKFALPAELKTLWRADAQFDEDGNLVVTNADWNGTIEPGESMTFGLTGTVTDPSTDPADISLDFAPMAMLGDSLVVVDEAPEAPAGEAGGETGEEGEPSGGETGEPAGSQEFPAGILAEAKATSVWSTGYVMEITLTNSGNQPVADWDIAFSQSGDVQDFWRAEISEGDDGLWHASSKGWNGEIAPGETVKFGFKVKLDGPLDGLPEDDFQFAVHSMEDGQLVVGAPEPQAEPGEEPGSEGGETGGDNEQPPADGGSEDGPVIHVSSDITTAELQALVDEAPDGAVLQLEAGTFEFTDTLRISRDDITIKGAGIGETILMGLDSGDANGRLIFVEGDDKERAGKMAVDMEKGSTTFTMDRNHSIQVGDKLHLQQPSDNDYLNSIGSDNWRHANSIRNTVAEVVAVNGREITLRDPVEFDYGGGKATVDLLDMVENLKLSDFTVTYDLGEPANASDFSNVLDEEYYRSEAITLRGTYQADLANIEALNSASTAFHFRRALDLSADNLIANGAHNKGGGGNGYAFELEDVYHSEFTNLVDMNMRHGFTMGSWFSSGYNYAHIKFTNRDVNFHGGRDHHNTVVVDESVTYNENPYETHTPAVIKGVKGNWGAPTDPTTNSIEFTKVIASGAGTTNDDLHATDVGAYMESRGGEDTLHGGLGDDIIFAGRGDDQMWGDAGDDTFVFDNEGGKWTDVIYDFTAEEDRLELRGGLSIREITTEDLGYGTDAEDTKVKLSDGSEIVLVDASIQNEDHLLS